MLHRPLLLVVIGSLLACSPPASAPRPQGDSTDCHLADRVDTSGWQTAAVGPFIIRFPVEYGPQVVESVDSRIDEWAAPGGRAIHSDYGFYSGDFSRRPNSPMREPMVHCQPEVSESAPQIALYRSFDEKYVAGLYWPKPGGRSMLWGPDGATRPEALRLTAEAESPEHLPELLAIVRSVRLREGQIPRP